MVSDCSTCGKHLEAAESFVVFPCPDCGEEIARCRHCKQLKNPYACDCGFEGP